MNNWNDMDLMDDQKKWSDWTYRTKRSKTLTNYASAFVFMMAAVVVMADKVA